MDQFPYPSSPTQLLFEKSATYLTHALSPLRAYTLLPKAMLIVILHNPVDRAYSWYQVRAFFRYYCFNSCLYLTSDLLSVCYLPPSLPPFLPPSLPSPSHQLDEDPTR